MIKSMTGTGFARALGENYEVSFRVRSVNSRFLDVSLRLPSVLSDFELPLKQECAARLRRGKLEIQVDFKDMRSAPYRVSIDAGLVNAVLAALESLHERPDFDETFDLATLLRMPGAVVVEPAEWEEKEFLLGTLRAVLVEALEDLDTMRQAEGAALMEDIERRLRRCEGLVLDIERLAEGAKADIAKRLRERLRELAADVDLDESRLEQEAALLVDRSDVAEEVVRLRSHLSQFLALLNEGEEVGRKMDFLAQEMNRETNTIGSKGRDIGISQAVIELKSELEKIREQVQNIE